MFFVCPKLTLFAEPENVIEFTPSAPSAFDAFVTTALASCALALALSNSRTRAAVVTCLTIRASRLKRMDRTREGCRDYRRRAPLGCLHEHDCVMRSGARSRAPL